MRKIEMEERSDHCLGKSLIAKRFSMCNLQYFLRFPETRTENIEWMKRIPLNSNYIFQNNPKICEKHFSANDYYFYGKNKRLKKGSVPKVRFSINFSI
jgi:hypothetical protein